jgi:Uma2 family endonuclease
MVAIFTRDPRPLTIEDLADVPNDGIRREIISGELVISLEPRSPERGVAERIKVLLGSHVAEHGLGTVVSAPTRVWLSNGDIVVPDISLVARAHASIVGDGLIDGAPDLAVEILSTTSFLTDFVHKQALYAWAGIQEYWIVDFNRLTIHLMTLRDETYTPVKTNRRGLFASTVATGLEFDPMSLLVG